VLEANHIGVLKLHNDKKKQEIFGLLSIILLLGITVQNASATIDLNSVDLICDGDTELSFTATIDFLVMCPLFGASPPIITLIGNPTIELLIGFPYIDDGATANDNGDGDLTGSIVTTGLPLDTTTLDTFFITFDVTDSAGNDATQIVRTVTTTKREPTANIGVTPTTEQVGGVKEVPSLSDVPSLVPSEPIEEPPTRTLDEIFDLFSLLFDERVLPTAERIIEEVEPLVEPLIPTLEPAPTPEPIPPISVVPSEPIEEPPTRTIDEIFDLFSLLFEDTEPTPTLEFVPEPESVTDIPAPLFELTPTEEVRPSFIESIQNFFAGLFG